jgi:hypothetical protein
MSLGWNPFGAVGLLAMGLACTLGWLVYSTRSDRSQNRRLALVLQLGGVSAGFYFGMAVLGQTVETALWAIAIGMTVLLASPAAYLIFLATVASPLTKPLQSKWAAALLVAYVLAVEVFWFLNPEFFISDHLAFYERVGGWHVDFQEPNIGGKVFGGGVLALAELYGLFVAISAYRHAPNPTSRQRALLFAVAFGIRDLFGAAFVIYFVVLGGYFLPGGDVLFILTVPIVDFLFYSLLTYGILKSQLFDIDLRLKTVLRRSMIALPFAAAFFVVTETVERFLLLPFDSFWLGLLAAGSFVLVIHPIQARAAAIADRLLPAVDASPDYLEGRKDEVYRNAFETFLEDGVIAARERKVLDRLRADLKIELARAIAIETAVAQSLGGAITQPA